MKGNKQLPLFEDEIVPIEVEEGEKPLVEATTLWDYPTQSYGKTPKGNNKYPGVTPAFIIYNLVRRYTKPGDLVVDPMAGSGTTIDVCKEEGRKAIGYDIAPVRPDIIQNDSRKIPLDDNSIDMIFVDSPYSDNIKYNDNPDCIGKISCEEERFFDELEKVSMIKISASLPGTPLLSAKEPNKMTFDTFSLASPISLATLSR